VVLGIFTEGIAALLSILLCAVWLVGNQPTVKGKLRLSDLRE
jgi:hypothetical protein